MGEPARHTGPPRRRSAVRACAGDRCEIGRIRLLGKWGSWRLIAAASAGSLRGRLGTSDGAAKRHNNSPDRQPAEVRAAAARSRTIAAAKGRQKPASRLSRGRPPAAPQDVEGQRRTPKVGRQSRQASGRLCLTKTPPLWDSGIPRPYGAAYPQSFSAARAAATYNASLGRGSYRELLISHESLRRAPTGSTSPFPCATHYNIRLASARSYVSDRLR